MPMGTPPPASAVENPSGLRRGPSATVRVAVSLGVGALSGLVVAILGPWWLIPLSVWDIGALVLVSWIWHSLLPLDPAETAAHARRENPGRAEAGGLLLGASVASLLAVGLVLVRAGHSSGPQTCLPARSTLCLMRSMCNPCPRKRAKRSATRREPYRATGLCMRGAARTRHFLVSLGPRNPAASSRRLSVDDARHRDLLRGAHRLDRAARPARRDASAAFARRAFRGRAPFGCTSFRGRAPFRGRICCAA